MLETGDFRLLQNKYRVKFTKDNLKIIVPLDYIRLTKDQINSNIKLKEEQTQTKNDQVSELIIPDALKAKLTDT